MKPRCSKTVFDGFHSGQCSRKAVVERDGRWYCAQHDPLEMKKREDARYAKWAAEWEEHERRDKEAEKRRKQERLMIEAYPKLLAENERLRAEVKDLRAELSEEQPL